MTPSLRDALPSGVVFVAALLLFGPLTFALLVGAVSILAATVGVPLTGVAASAVRVVAVIVAVEVVTVVATIYLGGVEALQDGSDIRRLLRHGFVAVALLAAWIVLVSFLIDVVQWSLTDGRPSYIAMAVIVALALAWVTIRMTGAFLAGYRRSLS